MAKRTKKIKYGQKITQVELGHYLGSLQESYNENLKAIREGFSLINNKLDSHTEMIGEMKEDITIIKMDVSFLRAL